MTHIGSPNRASKQDRKLTFSTFKNSRWRSLTDEHLTEEHWQPLFLFSKTIVSIHVCCSYIELSRSNCTRLAIFRLGIDTLIANILVSFPFLFLFCFSRSCSSCTAPQLIRCKRTFACCVSLYVVTVMSAVCNFQRLVKGTVQTAKSVSLCNYTSMAEASEVSTPSLLHRSPASYTTQIRCWL